MLHFEFPEASITNPRKPTFPIPGSSPGQCFTFYTLLTPSVSHFVIISSCSTPVFVFITLRAFFFVVLRYVAYMYKNCSCTSRIITQLFSLHFWCALVPLSSLSLSLEFFTDLAVILALLFSPGQQTGPLANEFAPLKLSRHRRRTEPPRRLIFVQH